MRWPLTRISDLFWATSVRDCLICSQCSFGVRSVPIADFKVAGKYVANMCFIAISSDFSIMFLLVGNIKNLHRFFAVAGAQRNLCYNIYGFKFFLLHILFNIYEYCLVSPGNWLFLG